MTLANKIKCNGTKPKKSEVYALAAELLDTGTRDQIVTFRQIVVEALKSYDYYDIYDYDYYYYYYYCYDYYYSIAEKVIALLLLSAMYESEGN